MLPLLLVVSASARAPERGHLDRCANSKAATSFKMCVLSGCPTDSSIVEYVPRLGTGSSSPGTVVHPRSAICCPGSAYLQQLFILNSSAPSLYSRVLDLHGICSDGTFFQAPSIDIRYGLDSDYSRICASAPDRFSPGSQGFDSTFQNVTSPGWMSMSYQ